MNSRIVYAVMCFNLGLVIGSQTAQCVEPPPDLVRSWLFDDTGETAADGATDESPGTPRNGPAFMVATVTNGLRFDRDIPSDASIVGRYVDDRRGLGRGPTRPVARPVDMRLSGGPCPLGQIDEVGGDSAGHDRFGAAVDVSEGRTIVGAPGEILSRGAAYIYRIDASGLDREDKLTAGVPTNFDEFGTDVAIDGILAIVGSPGDDFFGGSFGAAYVFRLEGDTWIDEQRLTPEFPIVSGTDFGTNVALAGDLAVVGTPGNIGGGAAYVFRRNGTVWSREDRITNAAGDMFGRSVAASGDAIAIGGKNQAFVYRFDQGIWSEEGDLTPSGLGSSNLFGIDIAIDGDVVVVGDERNSTASPFAGAAFVFRFDQGVWTEEQTLTATDGTPLDFFGSSVDVSGDQIIVGARGDDVSPNDNRGSAYLFVFDGTDWIESPKVNASNPQAHDEFGSGVAVDGSVIVIGAPVAVLGGTPPGQAYLFAQALCFIDAMCYIDGTVNPENSCQECNSDLNPDDWSLRPDGAFCGAGECAADTCQSGACLLEPRPAGTACGNPSSSDCDAADTCDGAGLCNPNWEPIGTDCNDEFFCNGNADACDAGVCVRSGDPCQASGMLCDEANDICVDRCFTDEDCEDGIDCTHDICDDVYGDCLFPVMQGSCRIDGICYDDGDRNPLDDCEECNCALDFADWSFVPAGSSCGSGVNTDCDLPDTCDGAGVCMVNLELDGTSCLEDLNDCTDDVCNSGVCTHPPLAVGTACGNPSETECDNPDTCDGLGICLSNAALSGTACTDDGNPCTNDVCDGAGACEHPDDDTNDCDDDGVFCNGAEHCSGGVCVSPGDPCPPLGLVCDEQLGECRPLEVALDIKPGSNPNSINCNNGNGVIPVAVLTTDDFDATTIDHTTVTFVGAGEKHVKRQNGEPRRHEEDVDGDGDIDLVFHFSLAETDLSCDSIEGTLTGETFDGQIVEGADEVRMVGNGSGGPSDKELLDEDTLQDIGGTACGALSPAITMMLLVGMQLMRPRAKRLARFSGHSEECRRCEVLVPRSSQELLYESRGLRPVACRTGTGGVSTT